MLFTKEQKQKMCKNVDEIKDYIHTLQPQINGTITVDFGEIKTYGFKSEHECHLYVDEKEIWGRIGGLAIKFEKQKICSTSADVYNWFGYTVKLIENWQYIKHSLLAEIENQKATIDAIENFEV